MKKLPLPPFDARTTVETCAAGITIPERVRILREALPAILVAESQYKALGEAAELFRVQASNEVTPDLDADLMGAIYKSHFTRAGSPSRPLYEQIKMAPEYGICPLCGQRIVATVDHYLPQTLYPTLDLTPANLLPACSDCNKKKLARAPANAKEQTLHPYFDDLGNSRWLFVEVQQTAPPTLTFIIRPAPSWGEVLTARVYLHFNVMGLGELYLAQAASEMADISYALEDVGAAAGSDGVRSHLDAQFRSRYARDANSWKTALYEGLRDSDWFCTEGYRLIRNRASNGGS